MNYKEALKAWVNGEIIQAQSASDGWINLPLYEDTDGDYIFYRSVKYRIKPKQPTFEDKCKYVLDNFDFAKVNKVMHALNWQWHSPCGYAGVPTTVQMRSEARSLLWEAHERCFDSGQDVYYVSCGGFQASCHRCKVDREHYDLILEFVLEEQDTIDVIDFTEGD